MSEPDAVPLPREGEVFFDVRGEARSMRLSWYANSLVAVFSIWQGNRCTGTFRLPFADLDRMVQTLQAGPAPPARMTSAGSPAPPTRAGTELAASSYPGHGYSDPGYGIGDYASGYSRGYSADSGYSPEAGYGGEPAHDPWPGAHAAPAERSYGSGPTVRSDYPYGDQAIAPGPAYGTDRDYGATAQYSVDQDYDLDPHHRASHDYGTGYGTDYDPPSYGSGYGAETTDTESVPGTAMMSFPSVPARNGPAGHR
jgi:hypothetical protein